MAMDLFCINGYIRCIFRYEFNSWCLEWVIIIIEQQNHKLSLIYTILKTILENFLRKEKKLKQEVIFTS